MNQQIARQKAFLTMVFGGPVAYTGKDMRAAHARLVEMGLNDSHFDAVVELLGATLTELKVPKELIGKIAAIAESVRADVLNR
jgi:hemoglobin